MTLEHIRTYCLQKPGNVTEDFPFDDETLVIKIFGKAFLLSNITRQPVSVNLKCDPDLALELRGRYDTVRPGYHMNKKHWNTVVLDGSIPMREVLGMIDHSYDMVVRGLKKSFREKILGTSSRIRKKKKGRTSVRPSKR